MDYLGTEGQRATLTRLSGVDRQARERCHLLFRIGLGFFRGPFAPGSGPSWSVPIGALTAWTHLRFLILFAGDPDMFAPFALKSPNLNPRHVFTRPAVYHLIVIYQMVLTQVYLLGTYLEGIYGLPNRWISGSREAGKSRAWGISPRRAGTGSCRRSPGLARNTRSSLVTVSSHAPASISYRAGRTASTSCL